MQFADVKTDIAFKKVFGCEQHKEILIGFLNAVLDLQGDKRIKSVTLKNPWQAPDLPILTGMPVPLTPSLSHFVGEGEIESLSEFLLYETILDIKAVDHRDVTFIVEMQVKDNPCFDKRALF